MKIDFAGHSFTACATGALYWDDRDVLIVSDLHLEKGSNFARGQSFLPPYDTKATLEKLTKVIETFQPESLLFLGDTFHDKTSLDRMNEDDRKTFSDVLNGFKIFWIEGNHDETHVPENIQGTDTLTIENLVFTHIAAPEEPKPEVSGHYHPAVKFTHKGQKVRRPCFFVTGTKLIMPAFGAFTGGLDITDPAYDFLNRPGRVYALGTGRVYEVPARRLTNV